MAKLLKIECSQNHIHTSLRWSSNQHPCVLLSPLLAASLLASHLGCLACYGATRRPQLLSSHRSHQTARSWLRSDVPVLSRSNRTHRVLWPGDMCLLKVRWHWWGWVGAMGLNGCWLWLSQLHRESSDEVWSGGDQWGRIEMSWGKRWRKSRANMEVRGLILYGCCG